MIELEEKPPTRDQLMNEAITDYWRGNLSAESVMIVIHSLLNPITPSEEDIRWAVEKIASIQAKP